MQILEEHLCANWNFRKVIGILANKCLLTNCSPKINFS